MPAKFKRYVAEIVLQIEVEGDSRSVIHRNTTLVHAADAESAFVSASDLGLCQEQRYLNPEGKFGYDSIPWPW